MSRLRGISFTLLYFLVLLIIGLFCALPLPVAFLVHPIHSVVEEEEGHVQDNNEEELAEPCPDFRVVERPSIWATQLDDSAYYEVDWLPNGQN